MPTSQKLHIYLDSLSENSGFLQLSIKIFIYESTSCNHYRRSTDTEHKARADTLIQWCCQNYKAGHDNKL